MLKSGKPFMHAQSVHTVERLKSADLKSFKSQSLHSLSGITVKRI